MSIKDKLDKLSIQERWQLAHAFDNGFSQHIEFGENEFVGVHLNTQKAKQLQIKEQIGVWSYGKVVK